MSDDEDGEEFTLKISGGGVSIDRQISKQQFAHIMAIAMGAPASVTPTFAQAPPPREELQNDVKLSLREYLDDIGADKKPEQIVSIGDYVCRHEGQDTFTKDDVKDRFAVAREKMPANFHRDFNSAIRAGHIAESHGQPGHYYVTKKGLAAIESRFIRER